MTLTELKKRMKGMTQEEMLALLCRVYKGSKQAQAIVDVALCGDAAEAELLSGYKKRVHTAFWGSRFSLKEARAAVLEFNRVAQNLENAAELMLFYVECGVAYTLEYGDIDERFYMSVESMFDNFVAALNAMDTADFYQRNADRIRKVCTDVECVGWGFPVELMESYAQIKWLLEAE